MAFAQPLNPFPSIVLESRLEFCLVQSKIVHRANTQDAHSRIAAANAIHEGTTGGAKVIGHRVSCVDSTRLRECLERLTAAKVLEVRVENDKIGGEHGRCDLATIGAMAHEAVDQARLRSWLVTVSTGMMAVTANSFGSRY